ncbi:MAG: DsbA family oxidoreductase [Hyphomonadaceae bacterium]
MPKTIRIDFVSDVVCPWCVIGLRTLKLALDKLEGEVTAEIHFQPFELNPGMPPEGQNTTEHVQEKYGSSEERSAQVREIIRMNGEALGFTFNYGPESRIWNTFDAHRLLHWAGLKGQGRQLKLKEALFKACFTEQLNMSDHQVLAETAALVGLPKAEAARVLAEGIYADEVRSEEARWREMGIQAVPSVIFEQRWLVQGGQPPETFEQAIRQIVSGEAQAAEA